MTAPRVVRAYDLARKFHGLRELPGSLHSAAVLAMLQHVDRSVRDDETPWCSAFVNYVTWLLDLPSSNSLAARSWLTVGTSVSLLEARAGYDVVVLSRGPHAPPASVLDAPGHVGFFHAYDIAARTVAVLGGNQGNQVCLQGFAAARVLDIRRLAG